MHAIVVKNMKIYFNAENCEKNSSASFYMIKNNLICFLRNKTNLRRKLLQN